MKKEYINPEIEIVMLNTMSVLAGSPNADLTEETVDANQIEASQWFDNGGSEDW